MKILLVTHHWHTNTHHSKSSGYERIAYYLSRFHDIHVLTWGGTNSIKRENNFSVIFKRVPSTNFLFEKRLAVSFWAAKLAKNYNLVHCLYSDIGLLPTLNSYVIVTEHSLPEIDPSFWMRYKSIIQRPTLKRAKLVITVSQNLEEIIRNRYNKNVIYIPHGIDTECFQPTKANQDQKRKILNNKYRYISLSCGIQGVDSTVFQQVVKKFPEALFIVVGRKEKIGEARNIYQPGEISEKQLKEFYAISDFCFKPLKFATANNAILEAMAMGKVNITNKIPGVTDYLTDDCAYLANKNEDFYDLFQSVMRNKKERERKGRRVREKALKYFSWEVVAQKIMALYEQVLTNGKEKCPIL